MIIKLGGFENYYGPKIESMTYQKLAKRATESKLSTGQAKFQNLPRGQNLSHTFISFIFKTSWFDKWVDTYSLADFDFHVQNHKVKRKQKIKQMTYQN